MRNDRAAANVRTAATQNYIFARGNHHDVQFEVGDFIQSGKNCKAISYYVPYRVLRQVTPISYEVETMGRRRTFSFVAHVGKVKLFNDQNKSYVDSDDEGALKWIAIPRLPKHLR